MRIKSLDEKKNRNPQDTALVRPTPGSETLSSTCAGVKGRGLIFCGAIADAF